MTSRRHVGVKSLFWVLVPQSARTSDLQLTPHCTHACRTCRDNFRNLVARFLQANVLRFLSRMTCTTCGRKSTMMMTQTDPEIRWGPISTIQMDGNPPSLQVITSPFPQVLMARLAKYITWPLLLAAQSSSVVRLGTLDRVSPLWWIMGTTLGSRQPRAGFLGRPARDLAHPCPIHCPPVELRERETAFKLLFQPRLDIPAGFLRAIRRVKSRLLECSVSSRSMIEIPMTLRALVCPASPIASLGLLVHVVPSSLQKKQSALSELHESIPVLWVDGSRAHSVLSERLTVSSGFGGAKILET